MRILYVTTIGLTMGFFRTYISALLEKGHAVDIACNAEGFPELAYYEERNCEVFSVPFTRSPLDRENLSAMRRLREIVENGHYDIVHCHTPVAALATRLACRRVRAKGTKVIYTAHGFHFFRGAPLLNWLVYYPAEWFLAHFTDVLITINREDYARAKKFAAKKVCYVPGVGIDVKKFSVSEPEKREIRNRLRAQLGIPNEATVLLSVGEINPNKNHRLVVEMLAGLKRRDVYFVACGRGHMEETVNRLAKELGVADRVILTGYRRDVADFYQAADIFVFPSIREGLPVALMETMASGLPVVCSAIRGNTDLIADNVNGCLAALSVDSFTEKTEKLIDHPELALEYASASREKIAGYGFENIGRMVDLIYDEAFAEK